MATLYLMRQGTGDARVARSFKVSAEAVKREYGAAEVYWTATLPTINDGTANSVGEPELTVIELCESEPAFGDFKSPGFHLLPYVDPRDAYNRLVRENGN